MRATRTPTQVMQTYLMEVAAAGRLELIDELALPDMVDEANQAFGGPPGRAGLLAHVKGFRRNIGNLAVTVHDIIADDDRVMAQWSFTGTHDGPWLGRTPTGEPLTGTVFSFFELENGLISRYRLWLLASFAAGPVVFDSSQPI